MARMFPTMVSDPNDPNRRYLGPVGDTWPQPLRIGYWLILVAAVLMLVTGMLMLATGVPGELPEEMAREFRADMRIVAWGNILLGMLLTVAASFFPKGSKKARRYAVAMVMVTMFLNFAGFYIGVAGWAPFLIVFLLAFGMFFAFRPVSNAFVDEQSGDPWRGVE